jgi:protein O-GlcNAc transferase
MLSKFRDLFGSKQPAPNPETWDALFQQAQALVQEGKLAAAIEAFGKCIELAPDRAEAYYKRGNALNGLGRLEPALDDYNRASSADPSHSYTWCNRGSVLERLGRREEALASYDRAIGLDPKDALTHYNRGSVLKDLARYPDALASYDSAIGLNGNFAEAHVNRGSLLQELRQPQAALESFGRAIAINPAIAHAFQGRGVCLQLLKRPEEALAAYNQAIALKPDFATAHAGRGSLLADLDRHAEAVTDYRRAVELQPSAETYHALAACLIRLKRLDLGISSLHQATAMDPELKYLLGTTRGTQMQACIWDGFDADVARIVKGVSERKPVCHPTILATLTDSAALLRAGAEVWIQDQVEGSYEEDRKRLAEISAAATSRTASGRIRIGYFSSDFHAHPVAYLTVGLFEHHDRAKFEVIAFGFGPQTNDPIRSRLTRAFDHFIDIRHRSDLEVAALAREMGIDIAVDLAGLTSPRTRMFALRAAPIQVNFLGYPGTLGAGFMDYLITDGTVVPRALQRHYAEQIAYLPDSFLPFDSRYAIAERIFTRDELGLPSDAFVYCCFNSSNKILPVVFDRWMRILQRTQTSVLWLQGTATVAEHLRLEASRRNIDPQRLIFAERMASLDEHVARLRAADLFLDTFPYNAHSTALDFLWAGVPLLTFPGESFASRVAASLLHSVGLPELIAGSPSQYEEMAVSLAADPVRLGQLRSTLAKRQTPLFDTAQYTRKLEAVYEAMYQRHHSGAPPAPINEHLAT